MWMLLIVFYGVTKGAREIFKKKAFEKMSVMDCLFIYTLLSAVFVLPVAPSAMGMDFGRYLWVVILKAFVIFVAWLMGFHAVSQMPVSLYGVLDLSRVLFSTGLGILVLQERPGIWQFAGLALVCAGLVLLKRHPGKRTAGANTENVSARYIFAAFGCCFLNAVSGTMDKYLMANTELTDNQLLFWYTLFLSLFYAAYVIIRKIPVHWKTALTSPWLYLMALTLVIGDKALFMANSDPDSTVAVMTLLKQSGCIVIILGGKFVFKEKNITYKLLCAGVIIGGIVLAALK